MTVPKDPPKAHLDAVKEEKGGVEPQEEEVEPQEEEVEPQMIVEDIEGEDEDDVLGERIVIEGEGEGAEPAPKPVGLTCCVMLQKEGPAGLIDEKCGAPSPDKMAGLCELV